MRFPLFLLGMLALYTVGFLAGAEAQHDAAFRRGVQACIDEIHTLRRS